jgi:hypothetical protein
VQVVTFRAQCLLSISSAQEQSVMSFKELEQLVLALPPAEARQLVKVLLNKLGNAGDVADGLSVRDMDVRYDFKAGANAMDAQVQLLIERFNHLTPERQAEVGDFIEFLCQREQAMSVSKDYARASENAFVRIWENDDDALYDKL